MEISDTFQHKGLRKKLTEEVRNKGIKSEQVLDAISKVPRHLFMDSGFINFSYRDKAFPIGAGQTISQPFTVAYQTELLEVEKHHKVLEVGTGSGYQAAVLLELGARVYTIERQKELYLKVQSLLPQIGYHPRFFYGDGYKGLPTYAPFDRIIITAGINNIPETLIEQLKAGGKMVVPIGSLNNQSMKVVVKNNDGSYKTTDHGNFVFVPMIKGVSH